MNTKNFCFGYETETLRRKGTKNEAIEWERGAWVR